MNEQNYPFLDELDAMVRGGYITRSGAQHLRLAYKKYRTDLNARHNTQTASKISSNPTVEKSKAKSRQTTVKAPPHKSPRKTLTKEQIREKNLALILILGVSFLLLGGFILATTNWGNMNAFIKILTILSVSILFSLMSYIARKLHIRQTAFAFTTLSALFLPIVIVCASYYQLLGSYLSLDGYGSSLLGFLASALFVLLYRRIARYNASHIFEGLSLLFSYAALGFTAYYITHQLTACLILINICSLTFLAALHFWPRVRQSNFCAYALKYERLFTQLLVAMNVLLAWVFWQPAITYAAVFFIISCTFLWCVFKGLSKYYHAGYLLYCSMTFLQVTLFSRNYTESIISWTLLLIIYSVLTEWGIPRLADAVWRRVYTNLIVAAVGIWITLVTLYNVTEKMAHLPGRPYGISLLSLFIMMSILVYLTRKHKELWFPYVAILNFYLIECNIWIIYRFSLNIQLRSLMLVSLILFAVLYLYQSAARRMANYQVALPIVTGCMFFISLSVAYTVFNKWEWLLWSATAWGCMFLTSLLKSGMSRKISGYLNPVWLGIILIVLCPNSWPDALQSAAASVALLGFHFAARSHYRSFQKTVLYTSGSYYLLSLLLTINTLDLGPTVTALLILAYGTLLSALFTVREQKTAWTIAHGVFTGATLLYPSWLFTSHGVCLTWILLYIETAALVAAALSYLLKVKKMTTAHTVYLWITHVLMLLALGSTWDSFFSEPVFPALSAVPAAFYMFYTFKTQKKVNRIATFYCSVFLILGLFEHIRRYWSIPGISFWQCVSITAVILFLFFLKANADWRKTSFGPTIAFLYLSVLTPFLDPFYWMVIPLAGFTWFAWHAVKTVHQYLFSYWVFLLIFLWGLRIQDLLNMTETPIYALAFTAMVEILCWTLSKETWKRILHPAILAALSFTALSAINSSWDSTRMISTSLGLAATIGLLIFLYIYRYKNLVFLPMVFLSLLIWVNLSDAPFVFRTAAFLLASLALLLISLWERRSLFQIDKKWLSLSINFELITAFVYLLAFYGYMASHLIYAGRLGAASLTVVYCGLVAYRSVHSLERKLWLNAALISLLWPTSLALEKSLFLPFINQVLFFILVLVVVSLSCRKIWTVSQKWLWIEWAALSIVYLRLMLLALMIGETNALLSFAIVALIGTIAGFLLKYKSYFFLSIAALLISLLYNRRHMWIELPWWFYLVIGGFMLIALASGVEWNRQDKMRRAKQGLPPRTTLLQKIRRYLNAWR